MIDRDSDDKYGQAGAGDVRSGELAEDTVSNPPPPDKHEGATPSDRLDSMVNSAAKAN